MLSTLSVLKRLIGMGSDITYFLDSLNELSAKERRCIKSMSLVEDPGNSGIFSKETLVDTMMGNLLCSRKKAECLFEKMLKLGLRKMSEFEISLMSKYDRLDAFSLYDSKNGVDVYDLRKFASMREYFSLEEYVEFSEKMKSYE